MAPRGSTANSSAVTAYRVRPYLCEGLASELVNPQCMCSRSRPAKWETRPPPPTNPIQTSDGDGQYGRRTLEQCYEETPACKNIKRIHAEAKKVVSETGRGKVRRLRKENIPKEFMSRLSTCSGPPKTDEEIRYHLEATDDAVAACKRAMSLFT